METYSESLLLSAFQKKMLVCSCSCSSSLYYYSSFFTYFLIWRSFYIFFGIGVDFLVGVMDYTMSKMWSPCSTWISYLSSIISVPLLELLLLQKYLYLSFWNIEESSLSHIFFCIRTNYNNKYKFYFRWIRT